MERNHLISQNATNAVSIQQIEPIHTQYLIILERKAWGGILGLLN